MSKELIQAIARGQNDVASTLISQQSTDVNLLIRGTAAIHFATRKRNLVGLKMLLENKGTNPNILDGTSRSPLMNAVDSCFIEGVGVLISYSNLYLRDSLGRTAYDLAKHNSDSAKTDTDREAADQIKALLATPTLLDAAAAGDLALVKKMIEEEGVDINSSNANGSTALIAATYADRFDVIEYLLSRDDILVDHKDNDGFTALNRACQRNQAYPAATRAARLEDKYKTIEALLAKGADVNNITNTGYTPILSIVGDFTTPESEFRIKTAKLLEANRANFRTTLPGFVPRKGPIRRSIFDLAGKHHSPALNTYLGQAITRQGGTPPANHPSQVARPVPTPASVAAGV